MFLFAAARVRQAPAAEAAPVPLRVGTSPATPNASSSDPSPGPVEATPVPKTAHEHALRLQRSEISRLAEALEAAEFSAAEAGVESVAALESQVNSKRISTMARAPAGNLGCNVGNTQDLWRHSFVPCTSKQSR
jgi:hypothetical protein